MPFELCAGKFWDWNQTWNNEFLVFSPCFRDMVFTTAPCAVYAAIFSYEFFKLGSRDLENPLSRTWLNTSRVVCTLILLLINKIWLITLFQEKGLGFPVPKSSWFATGSKLIVLVLVIRLTIKHRRNGTVTSHLLSSFWLTYSLSSIFVFRSVLINPDSVNFIEFYFHMMHHPIVFIQSILSIFVDKRGNSLLQVDNNIMDDVSLFVSATYLWFTRLIRKKALGMKDLLFIDKTLTAMYTHVLFSKHWNHLPREPHKSPSLFWSLVKVFWHKIISAAALCLVYVLSIILPALLLAQIIKHSNDASPWKGYFLGVLAFLTYFIGKLIHNNFLHFMHSSRIQFHAALTDAVFRKNLALSASARKEYDSGNLMNLISVDIKKVEFVGFHIMSLAGAPLKIVLIVYLLFLYLGKASLAGLAVVIFLFLFSYVVSLFGRKCSVEQMKAKDQRLKYTNEFLDGIKILKLYAWEIPFAAKISEARRKEIRRIRCLLMSFVASSFVFFCAPFMVSLAVFAAFLPMNPHNNLDPVTAFVSLALISQLRYALYELPDSISELKQCSVSLKRLEKFFMSENKDGTMIVGSSTKNGEAINIKNASFSWSRDFDNVLHDINLSIPRGMLIAVTGPVGSGKSSLFSAILGEMHLRDGSLDVGGSIAYVPQQPWILNRSLKENILLTKRMREVEYENILQLCSLKPDLETLPEGDATEIGEKEDNLSGGQKARVNLAQAVYQDKDIYLLDDLLSSVDVHGRKPLFRDVIGRDGLLRDKTRLLITHDSTVLPDVDMIINMINGRIAGMGTYEDLKQQDGSFADHFDEQFQEKSSSGQCNLSKRTKSLKSESDHQCLGNEIADINEQLTRSGELQVGGKTNGITTSVFWKYINKIKIPLIIFSSFWYIMYTGLSAGANVWLTHWSEDVDNGDNSFKYWRLIIYGVFGFAQAFSIILASSLLVNSTTKASVKYHSDMLQSIMKCPISFFDHTPTGRVMNRFTSDMDTLDVTIFHKLNAWFSSLFSTITAFMIIGINIPLLFLVFALIGFLYYCLQALHLNTFRKTKKLELATRSWLYSQFMESIHGSSSISAYNITNDFIQNFQEKIDYNSLCLFNSQACDRWLNFCLSTLNSVVVLLVSILAIKYREDLGSATIGLLVTYAYIVTESLEWLVSINTELEDKSLSIERIDEYCHLEPEAPWVLENESVPESWPETGRIEFHNYSSKCCENLDIVLKDVNISIKPSEKVGVVDRSGAGKSAISLALFRIIEPASGTILIDDVDISKIGLHVLRSKVTIIPQEPVLFTGSLRMNLDPEGVHSDVEIWESLEKTHLKQFVSKLKEGLEYRIKENGLNLSSIQRQLLCLARALLKNTKILVMDQPAPSIDGDTDHLIHNTIRTAFADCTVINIAHRLHSVDYYDKIVVLEKGKIIEVGKPTHILQDPESKFYQMNKDAGSKK